MTNDPHFAVTHRNALSRFILLFLAGAILIFGFHHWLHSPAHDPEMRTPATIAELTNLNTALEQFHADTGRYPTTEDGLAALVTEPDNITGWKGPYIERVPEDKWGHAYSYGVKFNLRSAGPDGTFDTPDDLTAPDP